MRVVTPDISATLELLDAAADPAAARFDAGPRFSGEVAVLPSAFNPPTLAHEHLLRRALAAFGLRQAAALLTTRNVDKGLYGAGLADRVGMLLALNAEWPDLGVLASNKARIIDQAAALSAAFPSVRFDFVVGFDTLERLFARRYYTDMEAELAPFFTRHRVLAANRGAAAAEDVRQWIDRHSGRFAERILALEIEEHPASLSSTKARERAAAGEETDDLPAPVARYIAEHGLYR